MFLSKSKNQHKKFNLNIPSIRSHHTNPSKNHTTPVVATLLLNLDTTSSSLAPVSSWRWRVTTPHKPVSICYSFPFSINTCLIVTVFKGVRWRGMAWMEYKSIHNSPSRWRPVVLSPPSEPNVNITRVTFFFLLCWRWRSPRWWCQCPLVDKKCP